VLLLIVLSLLVLFLLVGLSFMVSAGQFSRIAKSASRTDAMGMPGDKLADSVMYQLLRGTKNPYSSIGGHSLLEDLYGRDYMISEANSIVDVPLGNNSNQYHVMDLRLASGVLANTTKTRFDDQNPIDIAGRQETRDDYYAGCVLTFLNGTAKGKSTRIIEYKPSSNPPYIRVKGLTVVNKKTGALLPPAPTNGTPLRFLVNGRPFNGTGAGYNRQTGGLDSLFQGTVPIAFLPNYKSYNQIPALAAFTTGFTAYGVGGLDEAYDNVDYQNMFLGRAADLQWLKDAHAAVPNSDTNFNAMLNYARTTGGAIPSFHRPYLLRHLRGLSGYDQIKPAIIMRPSVAHHPSFTGSNSGFDEFFGPWDVDNDNDGVPDSIWIDAGLSPVSAPDGRLYKPLVAIYTLDMDGRINVNAVGSLENTRVTTSTENINLTNMGVVDRELPSIGIGSNAFGAGYGTADISLGKYRSPLQSRYQGYERDNNGQRKESIQELTGVSWNEKSAPGKAWGQTTNPRASGFASNDDQIFTKEIPFSYRTVPGVAQGSNSLLSGFGSPTDLKVQALPVLDATGNIVWVGPRYPGQPSQYGVYDSSDDPYEIDLLKPTTYDSPFGLSELTAINRVDPIEDSRLGNVDGLRGSFAFGERANQFTTLSFEIPALPTLNVGRVRAGSAQGLRRSLREMFAGKIQQVRGIQPQNTAGVQQSFADAGLLMAPEFTRGEKLDLNRALVANLPPSAAVSPTQHFQEQQQILLQKETYARYLYNLARLFSDDETPRGIQRIAQWSINVVDFGDADSVMTRFRYDPNPFDQDTNINSFPIVWGMEHPELLLTESLAFHDRLSPDDVDLGGGTVAGGDDAGGDLDSIFAPDGSLFIELYCPRAKTPVIANQLASRGPEDLYSPSNPQQQLELSKIDTSGKPVWRIGITDVTDSDDPQSPHEQLMGETRQQRRTQPPTQFNDVPLERFIYFTNQLPAGESADRTFFRAGGNRPGAEGPQLWMDPSSYLVIAPRDLTDLDEAEIDIPSRYGAASQPYNLDSFGQAIYVESSSGNGVNVSEPEGGYDTTDLPSDEPLDSIEGADHYDVDTNSTLENYRTVVLQRLANPNMPWDQVLNPYLTLDWIPVDLTVFNSEYDDPDADPNNLELISRERTGRDPTLPQQGMQGNADPTFNIWSAWSTSDRSSQGQTLLESLGHLNDSMGPPNAVNGDPMPFAVRTGGYYAGAPSDAPINQVNGVNQTLTSLVWHNRPYANPYELMLVPACSSARLTAEYTISQRDSPVLPNSEGAFGHLLNFFESSTGAPSDNTRALNTFRILDFVDAGASFIGTKTWFNSERYVSEFRNPGKVNFNTAADGVLRSIGFDGLLNRSKEGENAVGENQGAFEESLYGYEEALKNAIPRGVDGWFSGRYPDGKAPAARPNPVRPGVVADLIGRLPASTPLPAVDATLLRSKTPTAGVPGEHPQPALAPFALPRVLNESNLDRRTYALQNRQTNAYFRYRDLMKLGNSVTGQSNVFAVWVTVGYFEIEPNYDAQGNPYAVDAFHPDGYRFGIEMGSDVGKVVRHRTFYIIDRSIPVAFEPGVNHNVDDAILVRRQLE